MNRFIMTVAAVAVLAGVECSFGSPVCVPRAPSSRAIQRLLPQSHCYPQVRSYRDGGKYYRPPVRYYGHRQVTCRPPVAHYYRPPTVVYQQAPVIYHQPPVFYQQVPVHVQQPPIVVVIPTPEGYKIKTWLP